MKVNKLQDNISELIREETREAEMMGEVMGADEGYYEGIGPDPWSCAGAVLKLVADEIKALSGSEPISSREAQRALDAAVALLEGRQA